MFAKKYYHWQLMLFMTNHQLMHHCKRQRDSPRGEPQVYVFIIVLVSLYTYNVDQGDR